MNLNVPSWLIGQAGSEFALANPQAAVVAGATFPAGPFQESWYLHVVDPSTLRALDLRFSVLISRNGFKRVTEAWAVFFSRPEGKETSKQALKETFDLKSFSTASNKEGFQLGPCEFSSSTTRGRVQSKGQLIEWDLTITPRQETTFDFIPPALRRMKLIRNTILTPQPDLSFSGTVRVNGTEHRFEACPGMQGHQYGTRNSHSWIEAHCNVFKNDQGVVVPFVFEGISLRSHLIAGIPSPRISSFYLVYKGQKHFFNSLHDPLRVSSRQGLDQWAFQLEKRELLFRGHATFKHRDFAGLTIEDTNGSLVYCASSKFSDLEIQAYNRGKLECSLRADQCASVEICSRKKNPYVPILV